MEFVLGWNVSRQSMNWLVETFSCLSSRGVLHLDETWYKFQRGPEGENHLSPGPAAQIGEERWCLLHCKICWRDNFATHLWPKRVGHWHSWVFALEPIVTPPHFSHPCHALAEIDSDGLDAVFYVFCGPGKTAPRHSSALRPTTHRTPEILWVINEFSVKQWSNLSRAAQHKGDGWA